MVVAGIIITYTLIYQWAAAALVGEPRSFPQALQNVIEIVTTAGFGGDTGLWEQSDRFALLVTFMNISAVFIVFVAVPLFVVPLLREAFQTHPPISSTLTNHVIICGYSAQDEVLHCELEAAGIPYLYIDRNPDRVIELNKRNVNAILGDPEEIDTLRAANASQAQAIVADIDDETNPTVILSAEQVSPDLRSISVIGQQDVEPYHRYAGADEVVSARQLLGKSLAIRAVGTYAERFQDAIEVETTLEITELLVENKSDLVGQTFREATVFGEEGITIIGAWLGGKFVVAPEPDTVIEKNTILLVAGEYGEIENVETRAIPAHDEDDSKVVVCGYGTVGSATANALREANVDVITIDTQNKPDVDIVGDITDPGTFSDVDFENTRAIVLSLDDDTPTIYASLVLNQIAPDVEIIARADDGETVQKLYNAGADFVLSLPTVTGESLASLLIDDSEILTPDTDFEFARKTIPEFVGHSFVELDLRANTGCTVVAIEQSDSVIADFGPHYTVQEGDTLIIAGTDQSREQLDSFVAEIGRNEL